MSLDPFDYMHYKQLGAYYAACGLPWISIRNSSSEHLNEVDCPYCLRSEEYLAQGMEEALKNNQLMSVGN